MSSVVASDAVGEVGSGGCRILADFSALPVKSSVDYSVPVRCSRSLAQRRREPWLRTAIANALR